MATARRKMLIELEIDQEVETRKAVLNMVSVLNQKHAHILIETSFTQLSRKCLAQNFQQLYFQHAALLLLNCRKVLKENAMGQHQG